MFHLIGWLIYGLIVGLLGKAFVSFFFSEKEVLGVAPTIGAGMLGSYVGGFINYLLGSGETMLNTSGIVMGAVGAAIALAALHFANKKWGGKNG